MDSEALYMDKNVIYLRKDNEVMNKLTPNELFIVSLLERLEKDTCAEKQCWNRESGYALDRMGLQNPNQMPSHPLFEWETFYEDTGRDYLEKITDCRFISNSFEVYTSIHGDCFSLNFTDDITIYLMDISKSVIRKDDTDAYAKEVWLFHNRTGSQYLCCNKDEEPIGPLVDALFDAVAEARKHPKIRPEFGALNVYLEDVDEEEEEEELPF